MAGERSGVSDLWKHGSGKWVTYIVLKIHENKHNARTLASMRSHTILLLK